MDGMNLFLSWFQSFFSLFGSLTKHIFENRRPCKVVNCVGLFQNLRTPFYVATVSLVQQTKTIHHQGEFSRNADKSEIESLQLQMWISDKSLVYSNNLLMYC